jgi:hypothetical protein
MDKVAMYKGHIYKQAKLNDDVQLYPHQQRAINREGDGVIFAHGVGSGKTLTSIARFEKLKSEGKAGKALVVVPAGLRSNFHDQGVKKFTNSKSNIIGNAGEISKGLYSNVDPDADYNIISYEMFRKNPEKYIKESGADTLISDESHRGKNEGTATTNALKQYRKSFKNYIGLTGSVVSNSIADVQPLVDVAAGGNHQLGVSKKDFEQEYIKRSTDKAYRGLPEKRVPVAGFKHKKVLQSELSKYIDYADYDDVKDFANMPGKNISVDKVPVTKEQAQIYKKLIKNNPEMKKLITMKRLETLKDEDAAKAFSKMIEARKLMNSVGSVVPGVSLKDSANRTPKTKQMLDDLVKHLNETPDGQAILLTHLVNGGTDVLEEGLKQRKVPYGKFIGKGNKGVTEETRNADVDEYNKRKKKVMIISSAGGEGLSLNDTTWEGVLDPHYNPEKMKQMEARGIRSGGLSHRPKEQRNVAVHRYMATMPKTFGVFKSSYKTPDEVIYEIANNKDQQNQHLFKLLKENNKKYERQLSQKQQT